MRLFSTKSAPPPDNNDIGFINSEVANLQGWLLPLSAARSMDILNFQVANKIRGPLFEIGVFCGKYLSLMLRSAQNGERVVGLDTFQYAPSAHVSELLKHIGSATWIEGKSSNYLARDILGILAGKPRFISVDGSHARNDVAHDMQLSDDLLSDDGVIAADDFLNCLCLGVTEAIIDHLKKTQRLVPFAFIPNKLLLCRPHMAERYTAELISKSESNPFDEIGGRLLAERERTGDWAYTELSGSRVLVLS